MIASLIAVFAIAAPTIDDPPAPPEAEGMALVFAADLEHDDRSALAPWEFTDPEAWRVDRTDDGRKALALHKASQYAPEVRSPLNLAIARGVELGDFVMDLEVQSTARDYDHRDLCLVFGHRDPSHFYYVHLGKRADPHAHSVFVVDGAPRLSIATERTDGTPWTDGWHHVRLVRKGADGELKVYFDDMARPIMTAKDARFPAGRVGVGSFDDTGRFRKIRVWGRPAGDGPG